MGKRDLIVISSYPDKGGVHTARTVGVASYTKLILQSLAKQFRKNITVFGEVLDKKENYNEDGIDVERSWKRGNIPSLIRLFSKVFFRQEMIILVSFEINMFGGYIHALIAVLGMFCLKVRGKKIMLILHQAPDDLNEMVASKFKLVISNVVLKLLYATFRMVSTRIIVFEEYLKKVVGGRNIAFIPHLVSELNNHISKSKAREILGWDKDKKYALVFGYIAPYKGIRELLAAWTAETGYQLVLAGGVNPNHLSNKTVLEYYDQVYKLAIERKVEITGFVREDLIPFYYAGSDVVILPYKKMFSSSGPLAMAWSMGKPILMSEALSKYLLSPDVKETLVQAGLNEKEIFVEINAKSLANTLRHLDLSKVKKYGKWGEKMSKQREIGIVSKMYSDEISSLQGER